MAKLNVTLQVVIFSSDIDLHTPFSFLFPLFVFLSLSLFLSIYLSPFVSVSFLPNYFGYEKYIDELFEPFPFRPVGPAVCVLNSGSALQKK